MNWTMASNNNNNIKAQFIHERELTVDDERGKEGDER